MDILGELDQSGELGIIYKFDKAIELSELFDFFNFTNQANIMNEII